MKNYDDFILLINKDSNILSLFSVILGDYGYSLRVALDKHTAIEILKNKKIDLVIIDFTNESLEPFAIFNEIIKICPEIPKISIISHKLFDSPEIKKIYPYLYDYVMEPIDNIDDFRMRIRRAIENSKLLKENKEYQKIMIEKTFRAGMFDILSKILYRIDNNIDELLAMLYLWKDQICDTDADDKTNTERENFFNTFKEKILKIEEIIQLNEFILGEYKNDKGIDINQIIKDILETLNETLISNKIVISADYNPLRYTKLDSLKVVQSILHIIDNSIYALKQTKNCEREIRIETKNFSKNRTEYIGITLIHNAELSGEILEKSLDFTENLNNKMFSLSDIKNYLESINGNLEIISNEEKGHGLKYLLHLPVIQ